MPNSNEMVGLPRAWLLRLVVVALGLGKLSASDEAQAKDLLERLLPQTNPRALLDKPTGTAETIDITKEYHQASSIGASASWSVSRG